MNGSTIIFYLLAALTLGSGVLSVSTRQIFRAAIYLLFTLIGIAGIYFWLNYQFIAAVQIVVYVGGIVVLIIFSIFLTQQTGDKLARPTIDRKVFSALAVFCGFGLTMRQVYQHTFIETEAPAIPITVAGIRRVKIATNYEGYELPLVVVSSFFVA